METKPVLKSRFKLEKEAKDLEVYEKFTELMAIDGAQVLQVNKVILELFPDIHSEATIWAIRKRVEEKKEN